MLKHPIYISKKWYEDKDVHMLLIREKDKKHYVLIKDFNTFMYDHTFHCGKKYFCCYNLQSFNAEKKLKRHIKDYFKINGNQGILGLKKVNMLNSETAKKKL